MTFHFDEDLRLVLWGIAVNLVAGAVWWLPVWVALDIDLPAAVGGTLSFAWLLAVFYYANMHVLRRIVGD